MRRLKLYWLLLRRRMVRDPLPPDRIAAGWALGMFVGCAVPFGVQLVVSVPLALMMRVSKVGATVGTLITNPVTILFIYPAQTLLAGRLLGRDFTWRTVCDAMGVVIEKGDWNALLGLSGEIVVCFLLGGLILALALSPLTYVCVRRLVAVHRARMSKGRVSKP